MRTWKIALPLTILAIAAAAFAQDANPPAASNPAPALRVIVPWTHFGQIPATAAPADPPAPPQTSAADQGAAPPDETSHTAKVALAPVGPGQEAQASGGGQRAQLSEEDITKKHPHPLEPVKLPLADTTAPPLTNGITESAESSNSTQNSILHGGSQAANPAPAAPPPSSNSLESQIAALTAGYQNRQAERDARLKQLKTAQGAAAGASVEVQRTRIALESEQDRIQITQQLAKDFAALAEELDDRAHQVNGLIEDRKQTVASSKAGLDQLKDLMPRRELALRNLATLPSSDENNQMIQGLKAELTADEATQKLDQERNQQAGQEMQALGADAARLQQAAAQARRKSAAYAEATENARSDEDRLADRVEFYAARQRARDLLASTSKALDSSTALRGSPAPALAVPAQTPQAAPAANQDAASLRDCIRKTSNVDACLAQGGF